MVESQSCIMVAQQSLRVGVPALLRQAYAGAAVQKRIAASIAKAPFLPRFIFPRSNCYKENPQTVYRLAVIYITRAAAR